MVIAQLPPVGSKIIFNILLSNILSVFI